MSNLGETGTNYWCSARADWRCAPGFTTGGAAGGYMLTSVTGRFVDKAGSPGDVVVTLHAAADTNVNDSQRPDTDGGADNNNAYHWKTALNGFDETNIPANNGWTIADELDYRIGSSAWQSADDLAGYLKVSALAAN